VISDYRIPRAYLAAPSEGRHILASNAILGPSSLDFLVPYWQGTSAYWPLLAPSCLYRGSRFPYNLPWSEIQDLTMGPKEQTTSILGYLATIMAPSSPILAKVGTILAPQLCHNGSLFPMARNWKSDHGARKSTLPSSRPSWHHHRPILTHLGHLGPMLGDTAP